MSKFNMVGLEWEKHSVNIDAGYGRDVHPLTCIVQKPDTNSILYIFA